MTDHPSTPHNGAPRGAERRRYPRRAIALDVAFSPTEGSNRPVEDSLERTVTIDVSTGGMCLYTDTLYPVGSQLFCRLTIPDHPQPIELVTTVAWFRKISQDSHDYKLGVEFSQIATEDHAVLERLILTPSTHQVTRSQKVLLVDDDTELIRALKVRFESVGFQVLTATEGLEALKMCRTERPSLVILDLLLPKLSGYEVCRLLKFDEKFHHIPIILLTGRFTHADQQLGYAVGADAYVTKPFDGTVLLAKVDELLAKAPRG